MNQDECGKLEQDIKHFLIKSAAIGNLIEINVNEGDVVWVGEDAVIVAIS